MKNNKYLFEYLVSENDWTVVKYTVIEERNHWDAAENFESIYNIFSYSIYEIGKLLFAQ